MASEKFTSNRVNLVMTVALDRTAPCTHKIGMDHSHRQKSVSSHVHNCFRIQFKIHGKTVSSEPDHSITHQIRTKATPKPICKGQRSSSRQRACGSSSSVPSAGLSVVAVASSDKTVNGAGRYFQIICDPSWHNKNMCALIVTLQSVCHPDTVKNMAIADAHMYH